MVYKGSFEDILYVVIGLVWVAFSIYKGSQKQKKRQKPEGERNKGKSTIEEFLGNFLDIKEDNTVYQDEEVNNDGEELSFEEDDIPKEVVTNTPSKAFSYSDAYKEGNFLEEKEVFTSESKRDERFSHNIETKPIRKRKKPRFNVKKAIIYSEILKRPSY